MDYIRTAGVGSVWHIYSRWLQFTLCGLPVGGRGDQPEGVGPRAVCPRCLEAAAKQVTAVEKAEGKEGKPVRRGEPAPPEKEDKPAVDVEA